ncbi:centrosomin isoform X1 [Bradysia coprophila]|uniref:centrosomin isoform X1 n=2 Tax=Bradysia coprophila TaxID=38358 RepID=UPI00187DC6B2|nr:centrosomin isoform X1 [Bradysia coprophila]XP_037024364.1 centrosomin isoform X1 [Bradysia coprophila]
MAGIFRYNTSNATPKKRPTLSPFCTSPGQLQDVTMDNSYAMGYRSPPFAVPMSGGSTSPGQGRSIREHDEQLNALRKENFNLKLRIYFMEEKTSSSNLPESSESLFKENVDLKVQAEALRVELKEKQNLLCEAATALELMEQSQKSREEACQSTIEELNRKIEFLEMEIHSMEKHQDNTSIGDYLGRSIVECDFKSSARESNVKCIESTEQMIQTEKLLREKECEVELWEEKYNKLKEEYSTLKNDNEKSFEQTKSLQTTNDSIKELAEKDCIIITLEDQLQEKTVELEKKSSAYEKACQSVAVFMSKQNVLEKELNQLRQRLQGNASTGSTPTKSSHYEEIESLRAELDSARKGAEEAHKWRQDCADVCGMLTVRLKELAEFLDSLLKHKDILGVLAQDRRKAMRKAVDKSLDLSNSLNNISLSMTGRFSMNNSNLTNISSLSDILNISLDNKENVQNSSFDQSVNSQSMLIEMLRAEVRNLKGEVEKNAKKDRKMMPIVIDPNSDSEAWSEPDRNVSFARIGLEESSKFVNTSRSTGHDVSKSTTASEDDLNKSSRKNSPLKYQERIAELELLIAERDNQILKTQCTLVEKDNQLQAEHLKLLDMNKDLDKHQNVNEMLEIEIVEFKGKVQQDANELNRLRTLLSEKEAALQQLTTERDASNVDLRVATMKLSSLTDDIEEMKSRHDREVNEIMENQSKAMDTMKQDLNAKFQSEMEKDYVAKMKYDEIVRQLDTATSKYAESQSIIDLMKDTEQDLNSHIIEAEKNIRLLRRSLGEASLLASQASVERSKAMSEKLAVEQENNELLAKLEQAANVKMELNSRIGYLEKSNAELQNTLVVNDTQYKLTKSASQGNARYLYQLSDQSDFTSDELKPSNPSPDLGIESDAIRTSGSELNQDMVTKTDSPFTPKLRKVTKAMGSILLEDDGEAETTTNNSPSKTDNQNGTAPHNCAEVDKENAELKRKLAGTHKAYTNILAQLKISNNRKEQVERDIRREICKTQNVLKNVRTNIESVAKNSPNGGYKSDQS